MSGVYTDERHRKKGTGREDVDPYQMENNARYKVPYMKRQNNVLQNQQIQRVERDLEKTSKQLQVEIGIIQSRDPEVLDEKVLEEIDELFQEAESYFRKK